MTEMNIQNRVLKQSLTMLSELNIKPIQDGRGSAKKPHYRLFSCDF